MLVSPLVIAALAGFQTGRINSPFVFSADLANLVVPTKLTLAGGRPAAPRLGSLPRQPRRGRRLPRAAAAAALPARGARDVVAAREPHRAALRRGRARLRARAGAAHRRCGGGAAALAAARLPAALREHPARAARRLRRARRRPVRRVLPRASRDARAHRARARLARRAVPRARRPTSGARRRPVPGGLRGAAVARILTPGEVVLVLPFGGLGHGMLWQAEAGLPLPPGRRLPAARSAGRVRARPGGHGAARRHPAGAPPICARSCAASGARAIVVDPAYLPAYASTLDPLGITPERVGGCSSIGSERYCARATGRREGRLLLAVEVLEARLEARAERRGRRCPRRARGTRPASSRGPTS